MALSLFWLPFIFIFFLSQHIIVSVIFASILHEWLSFVVTGKPQPISALWLQSRDLRLVKLGCNWFYRNSVLGTTKDVDPGTSPTTLHIWFSLPAIAEQAFTLKYKQAAILSFILTLLTMDLYRAVKAWSAGEAYSRWGVTLWMIP